MEQIIIDDKRPIHRMEIFTHYSSNVISYVSTIFWFAIRTKDGNIVSRVYSKYVQMIDYV